ncbi:tyrosine-type recombinase/integrase [Hymenobacter lucidus]|uniref:Tyrosine-type recombinase/integrase n=1 Tax=Hymenobacter lucidus TaxID=2880930 RepID=A0ABS8AYP4_9BACT|nr:tyrosine-type recombinase/integrase [Hymenobacter lucidus]MCB2410934.1 tyrosine-type recombinase/integrase [Hymenobacter lucidus]
MKYKSSTTWPPIMSQWPLCSADESDSLDALLDEARVFIARGMLGAESTQCAYAGDWKRFASWCEDHGVPSLPAEARTVCFFLTYLAQNKKVATIQRCLAAINKTHEVAELPNPALDKSVKHTLRGIKRKLGVLQKLAPAFTINYFKECILAIDLSKPNGLRDRALLLLGLAGAFRRSEIANINIQDLEWHEEYLIINIPHSKTNQCGDVEQKVIFFSSNPLVCPMKALQAWLEFLQTNKYASGPLFVSFHRGNRISRRRLTPYRLNLMVKERLGSKFSAHSLRVSFITNAKLRGASDDAVMNQSKHRTKAMIGHYTRSDKSHRYNYTAGLGL